MPISTLWDVYKMFDSSRAVLDAWLSGVNGGEFDSVLGLYDINAVSYTHLTLPTTPYV